MKIFNYSLVTRCDSKGLHSLRMRITILSKKLDFSCSYIKTTNVYFKNGNIINDNKTNTLFQKLKKDLDSYTTTLESEHHFESDEVRKIIYNNNPNNANNYYQENLIKLYGKALKKHEQQNVKLKFDTVRKYKTVLKRWYLWLEESNKLYVKDLNKKLIENFYNYLLSEVQVKTANDYIDILVVFTNKLDLPSEFLEKIKKPKTKKEQKVLLPIITLEQILLIMKTDFDNIKMIDDETKVRNINVARDMMAIQWISGLRYGDLRDLDFNKYNVSTGKFNFIETEKTNQILTSIGLTGSFKNLVDDWVINNKFPRFFRTLREYNKRISLIMKLIGATDLILGQKTREDENGIVRNVDGIKEYQEYELIRSHTLRRSFATHFALVENLEWSMIMEVTGHTSIKMFRSYIQQKERGSRLHEHLLKNADKYTY